MFHEFYEQKKEEPKYVILGCQGSGTNLISRLLQQTLNFSVVHDRSLIFNAAREILRDTKPTTIAYQYEKVRSRFLPGHIRRRFMLKRHYRQAKHFQGLPLKIDTNLVRDAKDFSNYLYAYHAFCANAQNQALKSDDLWEVLNHVELVIPKRRYLLLVRDPRDNALSITNKNFGPRNLFVASEYVKKRMQLYQAETERMETDDVITISYESLLDNPQQQIEHIADKWQLNLCENYLKSINTMRIRKQNQRKWEKLSGYQLKMCEPVLRSLIEKYEYDIGVNETVTPSLFQLGHWYTDDLARRIPQRAYKTIQNLFNP